MRQFLWAALLALLLFATLEQKASAWGCCDGSGSGHYFSCLGVVPGPWYLYWPTGVEGSSTGSFGNWSYPCHFQTPVPIGDSFCSDYGGFYPGYWYGR
jgi:hypothetical protein